MAIEGEKHSPLEQFEIKELIPINIGGTDISFTNSALMMVATVALISLLMLVGTRRRAMIPGRWQVIAEM